MIWKPHPAVPVGAPLSFDTGMKHTDFRIGETFWCSGHRWRCTDIGTRVITAIKLDHEDDPSWYNGPPYAVLESVFDEYDIEGCSLEPPSDADLPSSKTGLDADVDTGDDDWFGPKRQAKRIAQAQSLRDQARAGGLRFDAYLPPGLAERLLGHIERGTFTDPSESTFVMLGDQQELEPHADLRREFLKRRIQAGIHSGPGRPAEEVFERLRKSLAEPQPEPAVWRKEP
jgi:antitoxin ParD1/3/4